jgi:hypothetical protein
VNGNEMLILIKTMATQSGAHPLAKKFHSMTLTFDLENQ